MLQDTLYLPPSSIPIMIMCRKESKPAALTILQCQKVIIEVPSVLPTVKKKIAGQEKTRYNG